MFEHLEGMYHEERVTTVTADISKALNILRAALVAETYHVLEDAERNENLGVIVACAV